MVYKTQYLSLLIAWTLLNNQYSKEHIVSETESVAILRRKGGGSCPAGSVREIYFQPLDLALFKGPKRVNICYYLFILTANGFVPCGSGTTTRHNTHHTK
jgi:hypothetical protein